MKKHLCILLFLFILICSTACGLPRNQEDTVIFFYGRVNPTFHESSGVIAQEIRAADSRGDLSSLINEYLRGPEDPELLCPFPLNTKMIELKHSENTLQIVLSKECANMDELDLIVSCSCLAKTIQSLTNAEQIEISAEDGFTHFDGPLVFTADSILTEDMVQQLG